MRILYKAVLLFLLCVLLTPTNYCQDSLPSNNLTSKFAERVFKKANALDLSLSKKTKKILRRIQKEETIIRNKLMKLDSFEAKRIFDDAKDKYAVLLDSPNSAISDLMPTRLSNYIPHLDSLKNSIKFILFPDHGLKETLEINKNSAERALLSVESLGNRFDKAAMVQQYLRERRQYLKEQLSKYKLDKHLEKFSKEVYYYSQRIKEYKEIISDPRNIERQVVGFLNRIPAFKNFIAENSALTTVFGQPTSSNNSVISIADVQTRATVQQIIQSTTSVGNGQRHIQQQIQQANTYLESIKEKLSFVDLSGNSEAAPEFKVNSQKSKSFLKRLEYGANFQFGKVNRFLPTTGEVAFTLGYKLNDNGIIGLGSSYKVGLANGFRDLKLSNQGIGLRSYIDWKLKGSIFVSGGYEKNYFPALRNIIPGQQLKLWQHSGLIGVSKKYNISKKRRGFIQLFFDFMSYENFPRSQPILFRTGINF